MGVAGPAQATDPTDALDALARVATGNDHLNARPNLVAALMSGNATAAQASAANQLVGALEAENAVNVLRMSGQKAVLPTAMQDDLNALKVNFSDVSETAQQQTQAQLGAIQHAGLEPVYDNNGQIIGSRQKTAQEQNKGKPGWFDSVGGFFHHLTHNPVTNVVSEAGNIVQTSIGNMFESHKQFEQNADMMKAMGYDPGSQISQMAFAAKGYDRGDISSLVNRFGQDKVDQAAQYLANPAQYVKNMLAQANATDPSGQLAQQKMAEIDSEQFGKLLVEINGRQASLGQDIVNAVGLDPIKNPTEYGALSGGINFVASIFTDPTILLGKLSRLVKVAQVGIKGLGDTESMARILDLSNKSVYARGIQRGFQSAVDNGNLIRTGQEAMSAARAASDLEGYAQAEAQVQRGYAGLQKVGLQELAPALAGIGHVTGLAEDGTLATKAAEPLDTYDKLFSYVTNTRGMLALASGKAAVTATLMPGALSRFGASWVHDALAGQVTKARASYNFRKLDAATKLLPTPVDAVDVASAEHLSQSAVDAADQVASQAADDAEATKGLASQARGQQSAFPSDAQIGEAEYNLRRYGNFAGTGALGAGITLPGKLGTKLGEITPGAWLNPFAITARARLAAQRLNVLNQLPRNNIVNLLDEQAPQKIYAFAKTYLPESQAGMLAATFAAGDVGAKRAILQGVREQVFHSAGLYHSEAGTQFADKWLEEDNALYSHNPVDGNMDSDPWTGGRDVPSALWAAQNRLEYTIPSFAEIHRNAAKIGLYEALLGRTMTSNIADSIGTKIRTSMLLTPRTATRATVEGWVNMLARGDARKALAVKAYLSNLDMLPDRLRLTTKATGWFLPKAVGDFVKSAEKRGLSDSEAEYLLRIHDNYPDLAHQIQDSLGEHLLKGDVNPTEAGIDALEIAKQGFGPAQWERNGWEAKSTAGYEGANRLEQALKLRQSGNPLTFKAVLDYIAEPSNENHLRILDAMKDPSEYQSFRNMRWANTWRDENGMLQRAVTEDQREEALQQHSVRLVSDIRHLVSDPNGNVVDSLMSKIRGTGDTPGELPDADWIQEHLSNENRPLSAIAPTYTAKVVDDTDNMRTAMQKVGMAVQDLTGKAYKAVVVRPAERMTSMPAFWHNYVQARVQLADVEKALTEEGLSPQAADQALMMRAIRQAWVRTEYTVDDPGLKTQLDVVGRNLFAFPRAINAFLRRYGQLVKQDPTIVRKSVLAIQGAEHAGLVYTDPNGELTYTVPGSSFLTNALNDFGRMMGYEKFLQLPTGDLTGKLLMSAPGFDNPIRPSMSPMLNIPFRWFSNMFPDHREMMAEIDQVLNGSKGAGRSWQSVLMPAALSHFWEAIDPHERNNLLASATIGAFSNLVAADPNGEKGIMPKPGSDPTGEQMSKTMGTLKTQVRNQLFMRAMMGLFLPGAPSRPEDSFGSTDRADAAYFIRGARSLSDEFKMMVNDFGGDYAAASAAFTAEHPNGLIYTFPTSTVQGANVPATRQAEAWMEQNFGLLQKYPLVAAYFAPASKGKFDANAYQAQLAEGWRQKKSISDFVNSYELKISQSAYFQAYDQMKQSKDAALAMGDKKRANYLSQNFTEQMAPFLAANPVLQDYLSLGSAEKAAQARHSIDQLRELVSDPSSNGLTNVDLARNMISAWDIHQAFQTDTSANSSAARTYESQQFGDYMENLALSNPDLAGLYNMFRAIDYKSMPSITQLTTTAGG